MVNAVQGPAGTRLPVASADQGLRTLVAAGRKLNTSSPAVVRQTAAQFMSELFFAPLLAEAREFPLGRELATGGRTEAIFGAQLDQRVADKIAGSDRGLLDQLTSRLAARSSRAAGASGAPASEAVTPPASAMAGGSS